MARCGRDTLTTDCLASLATDASRNAAQSLPKQPIDCVNDILCSANEDGNEEDFAVVWSSFVLGGLQMFDFAKMRRVPFAVALALGVVCHGLIALAGPPATAPKADIPLTSSNAAARKFEADAKSAYRNRNIALAITLMRKAVAAAPKDAVLRVLLGRMLFQSGDVVSAERELRQARSDGAADHLVLPALFQAMLARHEEKKLLDEFAEPAMSAKGDVTADILKGRAEALLATTSVGDAVASMDRSLSLRRDASGLLVRAEIATRQNDPRLANRLTDEALKLEPNNGHALLAKLDIMVRSNDNAGALALCEKIIRQFPSDLSTRLIRIDILLKLKQFDKAKAAVGFILTNAPNEPGGLYYKAVVLARENDVSGAWKIAQALPPAFIQSKPSYAVEVAQIAVASGNSETGASVLAGALAKAPDQLELRLRLAELRMSSG